MLANAGGALAFAAYGAMATAARVLLEPGTSTSTDHLLVPDLRDAAFAPRAAPAKSSAD